MASKMNHSHLLVALFVVFAVKYGDSKSFERVEDSFNSAAHYKGGAHNSHFDHQMVLGSKEKAEQFDDLSPEEARRRLRILVTRKDGMDANHDGFVDRQELQKWILNSFISLALEEGAERLETEDANHDGKVSWLEHINSNFESETTFDDTELMIHEDQFLFKAADIDGDDLLNVTEFAAFNSPEEFEQMFQSLLKLTMDKRDKNKDGFLDFLEFVSDENGQIPEKNSETYVVERDRFRKDYDINHDGLLSPQEVQKWIVPDNKDSADAEAEHLLANCDDDGDGKLSVEEIVDHFETFVGSEATDYGDKLTVTHDEL